MHYYQIIYTVAFIAAPGEREKASGSPTMKELSIVRTKSVPAGAMRPRVERRSPAYRTQFSSDESDEEVSEKKSSTDNQSEVRAFIMIMVVCRTL